MTIIITTIQFILQAIKLFSILFIPFEIFFFGVFFDGFRLGARNKEPLELRLFCILRFDDDAFDFFGDATGNIFWFFALALVRIKEGSRWAVLMVNT